MEGQNLQQLKKGTSSAESITLSFYVRTNKTGTYQVHVEDNDNIRIIGSTYTVSSANTWQKVTVTLAGDTTGALDNDNGDSFAVFFALVAGTDNSSGAVPTAWEAKTNADRGAGLNVNLADATSNYWQMTGLQMEVGEVATPFEHESFAETLQKCRRYFIGVGNIYSDFWGSTGTQMVGVLIGAHQNNAFMPINVLNPTKMRATPTAAINGTPKFTDFASNRENITGVAIDSLHLIHFTYDGSQRTANEGIGINLGDSGVGLSLSAEL